MAQTGFTPISLYFTTTASLLPVNTNLVAGELAVNTTDERLYFKNTAGVVKLIGANLMPVTNGGTGVTTSTGSGSVVLSNSPTLVTPALGTPTAIVLTSGTGLPISTGVSGLGTGVATFLGAPSSANLLAAVTDETGTGALVFATNPTLTGATLAGTVAGGGNQLNNVVIGASTPLAGSFTTLSATGTIFATSSNPVIQATATLANNTAQFFLSDGSKTAAYTLSGGSGFLDFPLSLTIRDTAAANATRATISSTGLAVTGVISATGTVNFGSGALVTDSAGNLGLGVVPSSWTSNYNVLEMSNGVSFNSAKSVPALDIDTNTYYDGVWKYKTTAVSTRYTQYNGTHSWYTAPSGTAGNPITFTQAMTLDASGNLLVGTTTAGAVSAGAHTIYSGASASIFTGHASSAASGSVYTAYLYNGSLIGSITQTGTTAVLYNTTSDYRLKANQQPLTGSGAFVDALQPKSWEWTSDGRKDAGFIAHEFQVVCPNAVTGVKDETEEQEYEVSPAVPATQDAEGVELTPAEPAVMGTRTVPKYQAMQASSAEVIANLVAELQNLRLRMAAMEAK